MCEMRTSVCVCVCVCFQSSLTGILAEPTGKGSSLFNYQGVLLCIESFYSREVPACV